jgi:Flp pilus assembly protein TadD
MKSKNRKVPRTSKTVPNSKEITTLVTLINEGQYTEAAVLARTLTRHFPRMPFVWMALGTVLKQIGRNEDAADALGKALALSPQDAVLPNELGNIQLDLGRLDAAEASFRSALQIKPDYAEAHTNLGVALEAMGRSDEANLCHRRALQLKPDLAEIHYNLGVTLYAQGKQDEAEVSYRRALAINPDYAQALNNLGITLQGMYDEEAAESAYRKAIQIKPDFAEAYFNLGNTFHSLGKLSDATAVYQRTLQIKPDFFQANNNLGIVLEEQGRLEEAAASYRQALAVKPDYIEAHHNLGDTLRQLGRLNEAEDSYRRMLTIKSDDEPGENNLPITALLPIGRAGSLFFHSLFDGHPEILTLPGVYFKGWFGEGLWEKCFSPNTKNPDWRERLVNTILDQYEPLFDARSKKNIPGNPIDTEWLARDMGLMEMGADRSQGLQVDKDTFTKAFLSLLAPLPTISQKNCFTLMHHAFDMSVRGNTTSDEQEKASIFYHIHNPTLFELTHFLQCYPQAQLLYIVRSPVQSMESWMMSAMAGKRANSDRVNEADPAKRIKAVQDIRMRYWNKMVHLISGMFKYMQLPLSKIVNIRGVRLEDVKRDPHRVMPQIAAWIGVSDHSVLYESSFCGLLYWGPSSKATGKITGFDTRAIDQAAGRLLGARDIRIFETLFWPFAHLYDYTDLDAAGFRLQLTEIRPWLDEPLEFETRLYAELPDHTKSIQELPPYNRLHRLLHHYWRILNRDETYYGMVPPFELH